MVQFEVFLKGADLMENNQQEKGGLSGLWHRFDNRFYIGRWLILIFLSVVLLVCTYYTVKVKTSNIANLKASLSTTTAIYDYKGQKAGSLYSQKGTFVEYNQIAPDVKNAVISTEDRTFWRNPGFSIKGMARAALGLVIHHGQISGGGSTITQQLAKNALLTQQQTFSRKIEELFFAVEITHVYSKKDILTVLCLSNT